MFRCSGLGETDGGRRSKVVEEVTNGWNRMWSWFRKDSVARLVAAVVLVTVFVVVAAAEFDDT